MKAKRLNAVMTVEMSIIIPMILFMIMGLIMIVFYFHDKNVLNSAASETAVVGSMKRKETGDIEETELEKFCSERIKGKCIFLVNHSVDVLISEKEVLVELSAKKKDYTISVSKRAAVTEPEKKIRDLRRLK